MKKRFVSLTIAAIMAVNSFMAGSVSAIAAEPDSWLDVQPEPEKSGDVEVQDLPDDNAETQEFVESEDDIIVVDGDSESEEEFDDEAADALTDGEDADAVGSQESDYPDIAENAISFAPITDEEFPGYTDALQFQENQYEVELDEEEYYKPLRLESREDEVRYTVLLLDNSGSASFLYDGSVIYTANTAVTYVKQAAKSFLNSLESAPGTNYVAIATYADKTVTISEFSQDFTALRNKVNNVYSVNTRRDIASGLNWANERLSKIEDKNVIKNTVLFTTGMTDTGEYSYTGRYNEYTVGSNWRRSDNDVRLYAYANVAYSKATELKKISNLYTLGLFQTMKNMPAKGADVASFFRLTAKDLATSENYFYPVADPNNLEIAFGTIADDINGEYEKLTFYFDKGFEGSCYYSDKYFDNNGYYKNQSLATMTLALAMSAFGCPPQGQNYGNANKYAKDLLKKIGIEEDHIRANDWYYKKPDTDSIGVIAGNKKITTSNGFEYTLIPVMVRGAGYEREWASNLTVGSSGQHKGFNKAKNDVLDFLKGYVKDQNITGPVKFWVTGYSRAAATANLVSAALDDIIDFGNGITYDENDVYAYTFETPAGALKSDAPKRIKYWNIFNYINSADPVPYVAPASWGFSRYGLDVYLPTKGDAGYSTAQRKMLEVYNQVRATKNEDGSKDMYLVDSFQMKKVGVKDWKPAIVDDKKNKTSQAVYLSNYVSILANDFFKSRANYTAYYQDGIREICSAFFGATDEQARIFMDSLSAQFKDHWKTALLNYSIAVQPIIFWEDEASALKQISDWVIKALNDAGIKDYDRATVEEAGVILGDLALALISNHPNYFVTAVDNGKGIGGAHYPELCYAWMVYLDPFFNHDNTVSTKNGSYRIIRINCEVDVEVKDSYGNIVAQIKDEEPVEIDDSLLCGLNENGEKFVILPVDDSYSINIKAREDDKVSYGIAEYNATEGGYNRVINYFDIDVKANQVIRANVPAYTEAELAVNYEGTSTAAYVVYNPSGNRVEPDSELKGEEAVAAYFYVEAASEDDTVGTVIGSGTYQYGSYAMLTAAPAEGYELSGWFVDGELVSSENELRIRVEKDEKVVAKFAKAAEYAYGEVLKEDVPADGVIPEGIWVAGVKDAVYTGKAITQDIRVYDYNKLLKEKVDYTISYKNNTNACISRDDAKSPMVVLKMKGNYKGTKNIYFDIDYVDLYNNADVFVDDMTVAYTGKKQTPIPAVYYKGKKLTYNKDFYVPQYDNSKKDKNAYKGYESGVADYYLTVAGKGNYVGGTQVILHIVGGKKGSGDTALTNVVMSKVSVKAIPEQPYVNGGITLDRLRDKKGKTLSLELKYDNKMLIEGADYSVVGILNNNSVGTAKIVVRGLEASNSSTGYSFVGDKYISFKIVGKDIKSSKVTGLKNSYTYTGTGIEPTVVLEGVPAYYYQTSYENNVNAGTAKMILTGRNGYVGTKTVKFKIDGYPIGGESVAVGDNLTAAFAKGGAKPSIDVSFGERKLTEGRDFKVTCSNNKALSENGAVATITGIGNFKGSRTVEFSVTKRTFTDGLKAEVEDVTFASKKGWFKPQVSVYDTDGCLLKRGTDYESEVAFYDVTRGSYLTKDAVPDEGDTVRAEITGKGAYTADKITTSFRILSADKSIRNMTIKLKNQEYSGKAIILDGMSQIKQDKTGNYVAYVKNGKQIVYLEYGRDFVFDESSYQNNVRLGNASVVVRGVGEYGGSKKVTFKITSRLLENWWRGIFG